MPDVIPLAAILFRRPFSRRIRSITLPPGVSQKRVTSRAKELPPFALTAKRANPHFKHGGNHIPPAAKFAQKPPPEARSKLKEGLKRLFVGAFSFN